MRAALKSLIYRPGPNTLSADPAEFAFVAEMACGPSDGLGEEIFGVTVSSPEWLAAECVRQGGILDPRHLLVVDHDSFDIRKVRGWLDSRVSSATGENWTAVAGELRKTAYWEFDSYQE